MAEQTAYGGFWIRFLAYLVDSVILFTILFLLLFAGIFLGELWLKLMLVLCLVGPVLYWGLMQASARQATFGKALLGMKVTDASGNRISLLRSLAREVTKYVSAIPLMIGFLLAAFTKRKQALHDFFSSTTVVRESPGHLVVGLVIGLFGWLAPAALMMLVGVGVVAAMMGMIGGGGMMQEAMKEAQKQQTVQSAPAPKAAPVAPRPAQTASTPKPAASGGDLEAVLAARLTGMQDKPGMTRVGPVVLELDSLLGGNFRIETYLPPLTEFRASDPMVSIARVLDSKGAELYDPKHNLEAEFFQRVTLFPRNLPVPHLGGTRTVHLRPGASASDAQRVEGKVTLSLPVNMRTARFGTADVGKEQTVHGVIVKLDSLSSKEAQFRFGGDWKLLAGVTGYGSDGKPVGTGMGPGSGGATKITFQAPAERFEMMIAESRPAREFPFTLTRTSVAGTPSTVSAAPPSAPKPAAKQDAGAVKPATTATGGIDALLAAPLVGLEKPGTTRAGPAVLELPPEFSSALSFAITANLPPLKEFEDNPVSVVIGRVVDRKGGDIYDPAADEEVSKRVWLKPASFPVKHLRGPRQVRVKDAKDFERVEGVVRVAFPVKPRSVTFSAGDAGKAQTVHGVEIILKGIFGNYANFEFRGDPARVVSAAAFGADQKPLEPQGWSGGAAMTSYRFSGPVSRVELAVAESLVKHEFPFTLTRNSVAGAPVAAAPAKPVPVAVAAPVAQAPEQPKPAPAAKEPTKAVAKKPAKPAAAMEEAPKPAAAAPRQAPAPAAAPVQTAAAPAAATMRFNDLVTAVLYRDASAVNDLLAFGKWPDKADSRGMTPLMLAAMLGDAPIAEALLKAGANPNRPGPGGDTAMSIARERKDTGMVGLLRHHGAR